MGNGYEKEFNMGMGYAVLRKLESEFHLRLDGISTLVMFRFYEDHLNIRIDFTQSHYIQTPLQDGPYIPQEPWAEDSDSAYQRAVEDMVDRFDLAVFEGHTPDESWLVPNEDFEFPCCHRTALRRSSEQAVCTMRDCSILEV
jgi:hypothetical protein